jgi:hypothetical protein
VRDVVLQPVEFAEQESRRVQRIAAARKRLGRAQRRPVHHLETGRDDARGHDATHGACTARHVVEAGHQQLHALGQRHETDRHLDDDTQHALGPGHERQQRQARRLAERRTDREDLAIAGREADFEQVVDREAVLQAVHAAGVLRDVAADRAGDLRRGVGRVEESVRLRRFRNREVGHARLHARETPRRIDLENSIEFREHEEQAAFHRQCAAG